MSRPVGPAFRSVPVYASTDGDLAADLGDRLKLAPDENQRDILDGIFAESAPGIPACFEAAIIAPRQNLKTAALQLAALTYLFVLDEELVIWTAHLFKTTQKAFQGMVKLLQADPDYRAKCVWPPPRAHGDEAIELKTGQRIEFHARSTGSGRGFTGNKIILDEALYLTDADLGALLPTLATIPTAQVLYASSAGLERSEILRDVRDRGRAGTDPELGYWEWCAPQAVCATETCPHSLDTDGCVLDRRDLWAQANPALGLRISEKRIGQFRRAMPPNEFRREFLGWWDDPPDSAEKFLAAWLGCADRSSVATGRPVVAVDVSPGSRSAAIVAATRQPDGRPHLELVDHRPGVDWLPGRCGQLRGQDPLAWIVDPAGPVGALLPDLAAVKIEPHQMTSRELGQACEAITSAATTIGLVHLGDPILTGAISGAGRRDIGDGLWAWSRRKSGTDICPLVAATEAHWLLATAPIPTLPMIY